MKFMMLVCVDPARFADDEAAFVREHYCLYPVTQVELGQQARDV